MHRKYVLELVAKFRESGSVANKKLNIENLIMNEEIEMGVLGQVSVDPTLSNRKLDTVCGVSRRIIQRILRPIVFIRIKFTLYNSLIKTILIDEDMSERIINDEHFLFNTCFSDERSFFLNGVVNRHNCRYSNPRIYLMRYTYSSHKNIWRLFSCSSFLTRKFDQ